MFGYVRTDTPNMYVKDLVLYKASYCGLCKGIGKKCGLRGRCVLNYDLTFLSVLIHNLLDVDLKIKKEHCILHPIIKRPIAEVDEITTKIGALNVILAHYKLRDDKIDDGKGGIKSAFISKAYKKAKKEQPKFDEIVKDMYAELVSLEKKQVDSVDRISDPFGKMMVNCVKELVGEKFTEQLETLSYNMGKWIYLIDALDDFDKDKRKKNFNVFINMYNKINSKCELMEGHKQEIEEIFSTVLGEIFESANGLEYNFNHDLIDNITRYGLRAQTKNIMENKKCKKNTKF
jgi:hypothetical protein